MKTDKNEDDEDEEYSFDCYVSVCGHRFYDDLRDQKEPNYDDDEGGRCEDCAPAESESEEEEPNKCDKCGDESSPRLF